MEVTKDIETKLKNYFSQFPSQSLERSHLITRAGENPEGIYFLESGFIRQYIVNQNGEEMTMNIFKPMSFFPIPYALGVYNTEYFFETVNKASVRVSPKEDLIVFLKKEPDILLDLLRRIFIGLEGIMGRMEHLMSGKAEAKLIAVLLVCAKRFGATTSEGITINIRLTHKDLASQSGLSRETVSREMNSLKERGILDYSSSEITIKDINCLQKLIVTD